MDLFEIFREAALRLYNDLVADGAHPQQPIDLVEKAVQKLDLVLVLLKPDDPALKGSKALFDEQSGTICCGDEGDAASRVLVIAHEIGHAVIHSTTSTCAAADIDVGRSTELSPVGLQRVGDYGARERRELQANVFAREFLLPRPLARRLYLDERLSASAIAEFLDLPKNLVRQQLLDTLLLPPPQPTDAAPSPQQRHRPDPSQDRAAAHRGYAFQLQAGPGTGKTKTLVKRVLSLLSDGIDPAGILVLTFSNRAAGELVERIASIGPESSSQVWIGTFHAFGLDLIRRYNDRFDLPSNPVLFDRSDAISVLEELLPTLPLVHYRNLWDPALVLRDVVTAISRAKDEMANPLRYRELVEEMLKCAYDEKDQIAAEKCLEIAQIYEIYERAMHDRGAVDFGDLVMRPALLLENDAAVRSSLQLRHRHVLVDEYQDVNHASARLLRAIAGDGRRLWVVGDSRQSIYRFRGASSENMNAFAREYPDVVVDQLSINYRSTEQIMNTLVSFAPNMGASEGMLPLALSSDRGREPGLPEIRRYDTLDHEAEGIAASIRELEASGVRLRDQAVLCRTNVRLNQIAKALELIGIPVLHLGNLFERDEIRNLLALLSLAIDPYGSGLIRIGAMPRYNLSLQDIYIVTRHMKESDGPALKKLASLAQAPGLSIEGAAGIDRLASEIADLPTQTSAWEFLTTYLLDGPGMDREITQCETVGDYLQAIAVWQFLNFVREISPVGSGLPIQRTLDRVRQIVLLSEERDLRQIPSGALHMDAVRLMTVHGSKGLEFEAVHIPGLTTASFPLPNRGSRCPPPAGMIVGAEGLTVSEESKRAHDHEEQCLFFVAMSRARTCLRLYLARFQRNGNKRSPSPFIGCIPSHLLRQISEPSALQLPQDAFQLKPITVNRPADWHVTNSQLSAYSKCPLRFFYTHMLSLGGARRSTAFSRTHDCLYEFIRWISNARLESNPSIDAAEEAFERIWRARGPVDHAFAADYRRLASRLISAMVRTGKGYRFSLTEPLKIDFPVGPLFVEPNEMAILPDDTVVLRRVRTGYKRSNEYDQLDYTLYHLAGLQQFGDRFMLEAVHLTDNLTEPVSITDRKVSNRKIKAKEMLCNIAAGLFPAETDPVICPRCPHFFICNSVPGGPLTLI